MKIRMKARWLAVSLAVATPSMAVPIQFDIAGTVQYYSFFNSDTGENGGDVTPGRGFTMQFVVDTDAFAPAVIQDGEANRFIRFNAFGGDAYSGSFTIDGVKTSMMLEQNLVQIEYADSKGTVDTPNGPVTGLDGMALVLTGLPDDLSGSEVNLLILNTSSFSEYVDLDDPFSPENLLSIALPNPNLFYLHQTAPCASGCTPTFGESWGFIVDSITRTTRSVPEPGTLSLLAMGLLGAGLARRRVGPAN